MKCVDPQILQEHKLKRQARYLNYFSLVLFIFLLSVIVRGQQPQVSPTPLTAALQTESDDDLIRVNSDLIQTGVSVFDRKGKFVNDLKKEDFELNVDGKIVPINFFENASSQSTQKPSITGGENAATLNNPSSNKPTGRGRNILFVIDDVHLAFENFKRVKALILKFIETEKKPEDYAAIVSSTGKIGFLQQFTNDDTVLKAALERVTIGRDYAASDKGYPPMTEFEAQEIERGNKEVTDVFTEIVLRDYPPNQRNAEPVIEQVKEQLRSRARNILALSQAVSKNTYDALEQSLRLSVKLNGRKIVFFMSDGFLLDLSNTNSAARINRITDVAARVNAVIYTIDTKGLDASLPEGTAASYNLEAGKRFESQDALSEFAKNTGGSFIYNTNEPERDVKNALIEASAFYLLAWEPEDENNAKEKLRQIHISVINRPQLQVKFQIGYLNANAQKLADKTKSRDKKDGSSKKTENTKSNNEIRLSEADRNLQQALFTPLPVRGLSTEILINYLEKTGEGGFLVGSLQMSGSNVEFVRENDKAAAKVELVGIIYDADGNRIDYFNKLLAVEYPATSLIKTIPDFCYEFQTKVKPGLYQIRIAARDVKSGRVGSNQQWIEIPNLTGGKLELSSLFLAERKQADMTGTISENKELSENKPTANVDRRFARSSFLQYKIYIYNYSQNADKTEAFSQNFQLQILSDNKLIATIPFNRPSLMQAGTEQWVYAAEIPLQSLPIGQYQLLVKVKNMNDKIEASQKATFEVK